MLSTCRGRSFDCKGLVNLGSFVALACSYPRENAYTLRSKIETCGSL